MSIEGKQQLSPEQYSPLTLAYIGDAIYEIYIRTMIVTRANAPVHLLHEKSSALVRAGKQSEIVGILEPLFTEMRRLIRRPKMPGFWNTAGQPGWRLSWAISI